MKTENHQYARAGAWWILLTGVKEDPRHALGDLLGCALIFAALFAALHLKKILFWLGGVLR